MTRITTVLAVAVVLLLTFVAPPARAADKPLNVVLILVDDMGWMDLSCQGSQYFETPHIDRLASQGMRFTNGYAACAVCSPTRAAVMTGRYPGRLGVTDWIRARFQRGGIGTPATSPTEYVGGPNRRLLCPPNPYWMDSSEVTIAEMLKPAGYTSMHIGKWHLGDDPHYPERQGFDHNFAGNDLGQPPSYFDPYTHNRYSFDSDNIQPRKEGEYLTDREADEAVRFIKENKDKPFFLYMAHYAVHTPIQAKQELTDYYERKKASKDVGPQKNAKYAAMVHSVDDAAGRIMKALEDAGVAERTLVIFTSDNGGLLGPTNNAPLRSGKGYAYEGGIRVPLIIRWPGVVEPGTSSDEPVISVDFLPTIAEATAPGSAPDSVPGGALPKDRAIDGQSLVAHLKSQGKQPLGREAIFWHFPHYRNNPGPYSIIRAGDYKLIKFYDGPIFELYNLKDDLGEKHNLAKEKPDKVKLLDAKLMLHLQSIGAKLPKPNPAYRERGSKK